jgi:hypothetical protein
MKACEAWNTARLGSASCIVAEAEIEACAGISQASPGFFKIAFGFQRQTSIPSRLSSCMSGVRC